MKTKTMKYLRNSLYDLVYLLNFINEDDADYYNKQIVQILNTAEEIEEGIKDYD